MAIKLNRTDIDFIWEQLRVPGNNPLNVPGGSVLNNFGIRDTQGVGNNVLNPTWGNADQLFPRLTPAIWDVTSAQSDPTSPYATRHSNIVDSAPRTISNLIVSQGVILGDPTRTSALSTLEVQDDPSTTPNGRLSPLTGNTNPLPYSSFMTFFGQFFDHGLDFVHKGADGSITVNLLPSDSLYNNSFNAIVASRTNTVNITIGEGSTDVLLTDLGLHLDTSPALISATAESTSWAALTGGASGSVNGGTLVLNNTMITINAGSTATSIVNTINQYTLQTGVTAKLTGVDGTGLGTYLHLDAAWGESRNTVSPFIDLSQSYGSVSSHTVFIREYYDSLSGHLGDGATGYLLGAGANGSGVSRWSDVKANATNIGLTLHDYNVTDVPLVNFNTTGTNFFTAINNDNLSTSNGLGSTSTVTFTADGGYLDTNGEAWLVALNKTTGLTYLVQDTNKVFLANNNLVLMGTGHAFLDDMAGGAFGAMDSEGNMINAALLNSHVVAGDGRANENIALTSIHEIFHSEHNQVLTNFLNDNFLKDVTNPTGFAIDATGHYTEIATGRLWSGEDLFQAAKLVTEMEYQHLVFAEFARKLSPNINAFAGYDITIDPAISAEFAHAVYRFGHSMLTETVAMIAPGLNGGASTDDNSLDLLHAFLNPRAYTSAAYDPTAGDIDLDGSGTNSSPAAFTGSFEFDPNSTKVHVNLANSLANDGEITFSNLDANILTKYGVDLNKAFTISNRSASGFDITIASRPTITAAEIALGTTRQVGNAIDEWVTPVLRDSLLGAPLDLATLNLVRGRDAGIMGLQGVRQSLFDQTGNSALAPYQDWYDFGQHLLHKDSLISFVEAYAADEVLVNYTRSLTNEQRFDIGITTSNLDDAAIIQDWNDLKNSQDATEASSDIGYFYHLYQAAKYALFDHTNEFYFNDSTGAGFLDRTIGLDRIDLWVGGLAEAKVDGGMLGSTFDFIFANQLLHLQNADRFYYLDRLAGTNLLTQIDSQLFSDLVMRNTGASHLYSDIFSVADSYVEMAVGGSRAAGHDTVVGSAGYAGAVFYGNPGVYKDARGVLNPNGIGNASEMIGGTGGNDTINGLGGNDTLWGDAGSDSMQGGDGNDFIHGGDGNDTLLDSQGGDFIWGDLGDDTINAGDGIDQVFGGEGNDLIYGGTGADVLSGNYGDDVVFGDSGAALNNPSILRTLTSLVNPLTVANSTYLNVTHNGDRIDSVVITPTVIVTGNMDTNGDADIVDGNDGNDTLFGGGGADLLDGGFGNDVLFGGLGTNALLGWYGDDIFVMNSSDAGFNNAMDGGMGFDVVDYRQALVQNGVGINIDLSVGGAAVIPVGVNVPDSFLSVEGAVGTLGDDTIVGGAAVVTDAAGVPVLDALGNQIPIDFWLWGNNGNDIVTGDAGNDHLSGGLGNDTIDGGAGIDILDFSDASSAITMTLLTGGGIRTANLTAAGLGTDTYTNMEGIAGGSNNDSLTGSTAGDILIGNDGIDTLNGAAGNDTLKGGLGNDSINGGAGVDLIDFSDASTGINFTLVQSATNTNLVSGLVGGLGNDVYLNMEGVNGSRFDDTLVGSASADNLQGDSGADNLTGNAGNDTLTGGGNGTIFTLITDARNFDTLTGGAGNDRFIVDSGIDNITDLGNGVDVLQVSLLATANARMNAAWTATNVTSNDGIANLSTAGFAVNLNAVVNGINGFNVTNTGGATTLTGSTLNDNLTGFTGNDTLVGGTGNDTLIGNDGNDVLNGGVGDDSMDGGMGNDLYIVSAVAQLGADAITDSGSTLGGVSNVDEIRYTGTTAGNLVLSTNISGIERVVIGTGTAASAVSTGTGAININAQAVANATQTGLNIIGNAGTNNIFGTNYNDIIDGGAGIDSLNGGLGNDVLTGGLGIDTFVINGGIDSVTDLGQGGADIIRVAAGASANVTINTAWTATAASVNSGIENITTNGLAVNLALVTAGNGFNVTNNGAATTLTGSALNDTLNGGTGNDILVGGVGSDIMLGNSGNDIFIVAAAAQITGDTIDGGANTDEIRFTSATASTLTLSSNINNVENIIIGTGTTTAAAVTTGTTALNVNASALTYGVSITGNAGANQLTGSGFADTLNGGTGNDTLIGGSGNDSLNGGAGNDSMIGGDGNDTYVVDSTTDVVVETNSVVGSGGTDLIQSSVTYTLGNNVENLTLTGTTAINGTGNALDNFITGNTGNNNLVGNDGSDTLDGGAGIDTLSGGLGNDQLTGGTGNDVFLFNTLPNTLTNYDTITDFTLGDKINLSRAIFTSFVANAASMAATEFINTTTANFGLSNNTQHIIYNTDTGALYYDATSGTTTDAIQIALLGATTPHPTLTAASFAIIA